MAIRTQITASYSTLSEPELLSNLVPQYMIDRPISCQFWQRGVNDTYRILCSDEIYSMRVYRHDLRTRSAIELEVAALNYLADRGFKVARPISKHEGGYVSEIQAPEGLRYAIVTTHAKGDEPDYDDANNGRLFGSSVAELHNFSSGFESHHSRPRLELEHLLNTPLSIITPFLANKPEKLEFLESAASDLRNKVSASKLENMDIGFCHGDCHGCNVHDNEGELIHFDFDCCGFGFRIFELATFKWGIKGDDNEEELWAAFLEGYRSKRKISDDDLALLDTFVVIRHIWWMALIMGNARDFGRRSTSDRFVDHQIKRIEKLLN